MAEFEVTPFSDFITFGFPCNNGRCTGKIKSGRVSVPMPNFEGEKHSASLNIEDDVLECPICQKEFEYSIGCGFGGGFLEIPDIDEHETEVHVEEFGTWDEFYEDQIDAYLEDSDSFGAFKKETDKLRKLVAYPVADKEIEEIIFKQVYSGSITCMEEYLSDKLINAVLRKDVYFRRFVESYKSFQKEKMTVSDIYKQFGRLEALVRSTLLDIVYHRLDIVNELFKQVFKIKSLSISSCMKIVEVRHNMVHRNGKTKEGKKILLDRLLIEQTLKAVEDFVFEVENRIKEAVLNEKMNNIENGQSSLGLS